MTLDDILKQEAFARAYALPLEIAANIRGRVCLSPHLYLLYLIGEALGDTCKTYLEIGVMHGGSMCVAMASEYPCLHVGIDPFTGFYGKPVDPYSGVAVTRAIARKNIKANNPHGHPFKLIKGLSTDEAVVKQVQGKYSVIDLLFIDGDHSEAAISADFKNYGSLVRPGGIVMVDNCGDPAWPGVQKAMLHINMADWRWLGVHGYGLILERK